MQREQLERVANVLLKKRRYDLREHFEEERPPPSSKLKRLYLVLFMTVLALAVLILPQQFSTQEVTIPTKNEEILNSVEKKLKLDRKETQVILRNTLDSVEELKKLNPEVWAKSDWSNVKETLARGQLNYRTKRYESASKDFLMVENNVKALVEKAPSIIENLLTIGNLAIQTDNSAEAREAFQQILKIQPRHLYAQRGLARALNLDKVASLLSQGVSFEEMDQLEAAKNAFLEAARLDPESTAANAAIKRLEIPENEKKYSMLMSLGYQKLNENSFGDAEKHFISAYKVFGNRKAPMEAIDLVKNAKLDHLISELDNKASRAKKNENWQDVFVYFSDILKLDSSLNRAKKEKTLAKNRIQLEKKISSFVDEPSQLFESEKLTTARTILAKAKQERIIGPKLFVQISNLEELIMLSEKQKRLIIRSDNLTEVRLGRDRSLGIFKERILQLKPGKYTLYGSGDSCIETKESFEIKHQEEAKSIEIICQVKTR